MYLHQGRPSIYPVPCIDIGPTLAHQYLDNILVAGDRRQHEGSGADAVSRVDVHAAAQHADHRIPVSLANRTQEQLGLAQLVPVRARARASRLCLIFEVGPNLGVADGRGDVEGAVPQQVYRVGVDATVNQ